MLRSGELAACTRTCLDCAAICALCVTLISRGSPHWRQAVEMCLAACRACAAECASHDDAMCNACAEVCSRCVAACEAALAA